MDYGFESKYDAGDDFFYVMNNNKNNEGNSYVDTYQQAR
jgi:hypothetical protein